MTYPTCPKCGHDSVIVELRVPVRFARGEQSRVDIGEPVKPMPDDFTVCDDCEFSGQYMDFFATEASA